MTGQTHEAVHATTSAEIGAFGFVEVGPGARVAAGRLTIGRNVRIHAEAILAGDEITLGDDVEIGPGVDLRSGVIEIGSGSKLDGHSNIMATDRFAMGRAGWIKSDADIACRSFEAGRLLYLEDHFTVGGGGNLSTHAVVTIGHRVALGACSMLNASRRITLEDQVGSGDFLSIWTSGFHFGHRVLEGLGATFAPVHIARNVWLAHRVTVLPGRTVGANSIVAAGSIVTKDIPADVMAAGAPAEARREIRFHQAEPEVAERILVEILTSWAIELAWKGWAAEPRRNETERLSIRLVDPLAGRAGSVVLVRHADELPTPAHGDDFSVVVSLNPDEMAEWDCANQWALLNVVRGSYSGASFDVAEDLRDFLRRHTLPCGDERRFCSIEPIHATKLRQMI